MIYAQYFTSHFIAAKIAQLECRNYFQKNLQHPIVKLDASVKVSTLTFGA